MNNARRKSLAALAEQIRALAGQIEDIRSELETLRDEEQEYYDNMPESFQGGDKGQAAEAAVSAMEDALGELPDLEEVADYLDTAAE